ncbi:MAG TPA: DUF3040 domain-containing protein [Trebonia sp.]
MTLSAREQRILSEIERELTAAEPLLGRALARMRIGLRGRRSAGPAARRLIGANARQAWIIGMIGLLLAGIALLSVGLALDLLAAVIVGIVLTQLSLFTGWFARALSGRRLAGQ